jgi:hypothetical protein
MYNEAVVEYQRILRFNPNYPLAQYHLDRRDGDTVEAESRSMQHSQHLAPLGDKVASVSLAFLHRSD